MARAGVYVAVHEPFNQLICSTTYRWRLGAVPALAVQGCGLRRARRHAPSRRPHPLDPARRRPRRARRASTAARARRPATISISSPNADPAVAGEVDGERPGRRPGRRILGDAERGREHARLPARRPSRAKQSRRPRRPAERAEVGLERGDLPRASRARRRRSRGRGRRSRPAGPSARRRAPRAARRRARTAPMRGIGCSIQPKTIFGALALELDRDDAGAGLEPEHDLLQRPAEHERRPERRMAGERQLGRRA